jgi:hypothetical protein
LDAGAYAFFTSLHAYVHSLPLTFPNFDPKLQHLNFNFNCASGGVGCFAIHPGRELIAVGERGGGGGSGGGGSGSGGGGSQPAIYMLRYPDFAVVKALMGGAERGYRWALN